MDDIDGFKTSMEDITANVVEIRRELELAVELEDETGLLQSPNKTLIVEELLLVEEQIKSDFLK